MNRRQELLARISEFLDIGGAEVSLELGAIALDMQDYLQQPDEEAEVPIKDKETILKMNADNLKDFSLSLQAENQQLKTSLKKRDLLDKYRPYFGYEDLEKIEPIVEKLAKNEPLSTDEVVYFSSLSSPNREEIDKREEETLERRKILIRKGGLKIKK